MGEIYSNLLSYRPAHIAAVEAILITLVKRVNYFQENLDLDELVFYIGRRLSVALPPPLEFMNVYYSLVFDFLKLAEQYRNHYSTLLLDFLSKMFDITDNQKNQLIKIFNRQEESQAIPLPRICSQDINYLTNVTGTVEEYINEIKNRRHSLLIALFAMLEYFLTYLPIQESVCLFKILYQKEFKNIIILAGVNHTRRLFHLLSQTDKPPVCSSKINNPSFHDINNFKTQFIKNLKK